ncbi:hypothetical protein Pla86_52890 (plasmid) [Planctomycetes bacterium Pla86]|uniref:Uncharacterized protein n=1 Tax=Engelhardtia mirabilis TaxID=2528011 RepID=A0A518BT83_9BACT|nr:hypothetical protein Pla133_52890 [Planctomycetes bacterium Pla133]QDV04493.1 hypothetical protein Pla86_52890 [Planctomycetes bacterium Pla86]
MKSNEHVDLALGLQRSLRWRAFRRRAAMFVAALFFAEHVGLPHARWTEEPRRGRAAETIYWSVTGVAREPRSPHAGNRPLLLLIPMDPKPSEYSAMVLHRGLELAADRLNIVRNQP